MMQKFLLAHAMFFGAMAGIAFFGAGEFVSSVIHQVAQPHFSAFTFNTSSMVWALLKSVVIGVPVGQSCGAAAREWIVGNRSGAKSICRSAGKCVIVLFLGLLMPFIAVIDFTPNGFLFHQITELYFESFPLQIGIFLLVLSHSLPDQNRETVQITENLRL